MESVGHLTGGMAHDFNNMLTVITGTIDFLAAAVADKPELAAIATLISEAAERGAELTGQLLAFARKQPLQPRETDINGLMVERQTCCGRLWASISRSRRFCGRRLGGSGRSESTYFGAPNLAINARDAMPEAAS